MREEAIIYINKRPFVLREVEHPMINMSAYAGISLLLLLLLLLILIRIICTRGIKLFNFNSLSISLFAHKRGPIE